MEQNVNKKFSVSDALYQSVMEVMKGSKEGSTPRNEKEKDLAKFTVILTVSHTVMSLKHVV